MSTQETAWQAGESAASVLGSEADLFASADAAALRYHGGGLLLHHRDLKNA
jgi:hypothetical protein